MLLKHVVGRLYDGNGEDVFYHIYVIDPFLKITTEKMIHGAQCQDAHKKTDRLGHPYGTCGTAEVLAPGSFVRDNKQWVKTECTQNTFCV